jgi:hypothetical protein
MVDDIENILLAKIHVAIRRSRITTQEEQAFLSTLKLRTADITFHHQERGRRTCFLLKHMINKIRNFLADARSCPTPEPAVFQFHAIFKRFAPASVIKCRSRPSPVASSVGLHHNGFGLSPALPPTIADHDQLSTPASVDNVPDVYIGGVDDAGGVAGGCVHRRLDVGATSPSGAHIKSDVSSTPPKPPPPSMSCPSCPSCPSRSKPPDHSALVISVPAALDVAQCVTTARHQPDSFVVGSADGLSGEPVPSPAGVTVNLASVDVVSSAGVHIECDVSPTRRSMPPHPYPMSRSSQLTPPASGAQALSVLATRDVTQRTTTRQRSGGKPVGTVVGLSSTDPSPSPVVGIKGSLASVSDVAKSSSGASTTAGSVTDVHTPWLDSVAPAVSTLADDDPPAPLCSLSVHASSVSGHILGARTTAVKSRGVLSVDATTSAASTLPFPTEWPSVNHSGTAVDGPHVDVSAVTSSIGPHHHGSGTSLTTLSSATIGYHQLKTPASVYNVPDVSIGGVCDAGIAGGRCIHRRDDVASSPASTAHMKRDVSPTPTKPPPSMSSLLQLEPPDSSVMVISVPAAPNKARCTTSVETTSNAANALSSSYAFCAASVDDSGTAVNVRNVDVSAGTTSTRAPGSTTHASRVNCGGLSAVSIARAIHPLDRCGCFCWGRRSTRASVCANHGRGCSGFGVHPSPADELGKCVLQRAPSHLCPPSHTGSVVQPVQAAFAAAHHTTRQQSERSMIDAIDGSSEPFSARAAVKDFLSPIADIAGLPSGDPIPAGLVADVLSSGHNGVAQAASTLADDDPAHMGSIFVPSPVSGLSLEDMDLPATQSRGRVSRFTPSASTVHTSNSQTTSATAPQVWAHSTLADDDLAPRATQHRLTMFPMFTLGECVMRGLLFVVAPMRTLVDRSTPWDLSTLADDDPAVPTTLAVVAGGGATAGLVFLTSLFRSLLLLFHLHCSSGLSYGLHCPNHRSFLWMSPRVQALDIPVPQGTGLSDQLHLNFDISSLHPVPGSDMTASLSGSVQRSMLPTVRSVEQPCCPPNSITQLIASLLDDDPKFSSLAVNDQLDWLLAETLTILASLFAALLVHRSLHSSVFQSKEWGSVSMHITCSAQISPRRGNAHDESD